ncbi:MAG: DUF3955 domain-containing protein [Glaciimonas sp.]|nr:DUF3955 domain-containing protein [Glaciimonas sp.]
MNNITFKKTCWWAAGLLFVGLICFLISGMIGSTIDAQSYLHEPAFGLIPIGFFLMSMGVVLGVVGLIVRGVRLLRQR